VLNRAIHTLWDMLNEIYRTWLLVVKDYRLNERHHGALQGLNKAGMAKQYGGEQVLICYTASSGTLRPSWPACRPSLCPFAARTDSRDRVLEGRSRPCRALLERDDFSQHPLGPARADL